MTHFVGLVIGPDVAGQLARYDENLEVEEHKDYFVPPSETEAGDLWPYSTALHVDPGIDLHDPHAVAKALNMAFGEGYDADENGIYQISTANPDGRWDYWRIGGRWGKGSDWDSDPDHSYLILRDGTDSVAAPASSIDWDRTVLERAFVPSVLVAEGVWRQRYAWGWFGVIYDEEMSETDWQVFVTRMITGAGDLDVTVVDFHV